MVVVSQKLGSSDLDDIDFNHDLEDAPVNTWHSLFKKTKRVKFVFIVQSLFDGLAIHLISGLKLSRLRSRFSVYKQENFSIQIVIAIQIIFPLYTEYRPRKSCVCFAWCYDIHSIIASFGTVRAPSRFRFHVKSMGDFSLLQITAI